MNAQTVWKWTLTARDLTTIRVPKGGKLLSVHEQRGQICLWALVDPQKETEERTIRIAGTGHILANGKFQYLGSVHLDAGQLVFHVFECLP